LNLISYIKKIERIKSKKKIRKETMFPDYYFCHFKSDEIAQTSEVVLAIKIRCSPGRRLPSISIPFKPLDELNKTYFEVSNKQDQLDKMIYEKICPDHDKYSTNADVWKAFVKFMEDKNN
jgi:hypothetical protein